MKSFITQHRLAMNQKYCLWMNMPSHHQMDFIKAIHEAGVDLQVRFYGKVDDRRKIMGWDSGPKLDQYSQSVKPSMDAAEASVPDWRERIHIIPGTVGDKFLMALVDFLIKEKVSWVHWSEDVKPGLNRIIRLPFRKRYGQKINRYALGALAISKTAEKEFISWGVAPVKIGWLPYVANPLKESGEADEQIKKFVHDRFTFMFSGALCPRKATDLLLHSFKRVADQYPQAALILVGPDTSDRYYQNYSDRIHIPKGQVLFTGAVAYEQMKSILPLCNVFVLPSRYDGWGMVIYEAASMGKAVIATDRCGVSQHMIIDGVNGFRVKAGDLGALVCAMESYLKSPGLAQIHGSHSKIIAEFFYPHKNVERFLCVMESFLTTKKPPEAQP